MFRSGRRGPLSRVGPERGRTVARGPIHPGETLREDLDALGMSAADLARRIDVPPDRIARILVP